jgi:hypothetical protein
MCMQFESDEEAAKEEEEEALRLQKVQAAKLSRAQFGLPDDCSEEDDDEKEDEGNAAKASTLGTTAEVCCPTLTAEQVQNDTTTSQVAV